MLHTDISNKKECFFLSIGIDLCQVFIIYGTIPSYSPANITHIHVHITMETPKNVTNHRVQPPSEQTLLAVAGLAIGRS